LTGKALLSHVNSNINMASEFDLNFDEPLWNTSWFPVEERNITEGSGIYVGRNAAESYHY